MNILSPYFRNVIELICLHLDINEFFALKHSCKTMNEWLSDKYCKPLITKKLECKKIKGGRPNGEVIIGCKKCNNHTRNCPKFYSIHNYRDGILEGACYINGQIGKDSCSYVGEYHDGMKHGIWRILTKYSIMLIMNYDFGIPYGLCTWVDDFEHMKGYYKNGKKIDYWIYVEGKCLDNTDYVIDFSEFDLSRSDIRDSGKLIWDRWMSLSYKRRIEHYNQDGKKHGRCARWSTDNNVIYSIPYVNGEVHGQAFKYVYKRGWVYWEYDHGTKIDEWDLEECPNVFPF